MCSTNLKGSFVQHLFYCHAVYMLHLLTNFMIFVQSHGAADELGWWSTAV